MDANWARRNSFSRKICLALLGRRAILLVFAGPVLRNHLTIHQSVIIPEVDLTLGGEDRSGVEVPHGLKQRWKPFGYSKLTRRW